MRDFLETGDTVDCVILDALMPGEASASLALHLKERGISVVMISGSPEAMKYAVDNGLQLLRKPFHLQELGIVLHSARRAFPISRPLRLPPPTRAAEGIDRRLAEAEFRPYIGRDCQYRKYRLFATTTDSIPMQ